MFRKKEDKAVKDYWERLQKDMERIDRIEKICVTREVCSPDDKGAAHLMGTQGFIRDVTLKTRMDRIEKKLDDLMAYLKLEVHTPDCTPVLRKRSEK